MLYWKNERKFLDGNFREHMKEDSWGKNNVKTEPPLSPGLIIPKNSPPKMSEEQTAAPANDRKRKLVIQMAEEIKQALLREFEKIKVIEMAEEIKKALLREFEKCEEALKAIESEPKMSKTEVAHFPVTKRVTEEKPYTTLLYVYGPTATNSRCPREDVIAHFQGLLDEKSYEEGAAHDYRDEKVTFNPKAGFRGVHTCEGQGCGNPDSFSRDLHLLNRGQPTRFVANSLCAHYLTDHWDDAKKQLERINRYLAVVGIKPID